MSNELDATALRRLQDSYDFLRSQQFLSSYASLDDLVVAMDQHWSLEPDDYLTLPQSHLDEMALCTDKVRVYHAPSDEYRPNQDAYAQLIAACARISDGNLVIGHVEETWSDFDTVTVRWQANGSAYEAVPRAKYIDVSILDVLNQAIDGPKRFLAGDGLGMPTTILFIDDQTAERLQRDRGLGFAGVALRPATDTGAAVEAEQKPRRSGWRRFLPR